MCGGGGFRTVHGRRRRGDGRRRGERSRGDNVGAEVDASASAGGGVGGGGIGGGRIELMGMDDGFDVEARVAAVSAWQGQ